MSHFINHNYRIVHISVAGTSTCITCTNQHLAFWSTLSGAKHACRDRRILLASIRPNIVLVSHP